MAKIAYSYLRFSTSIQQYGDSTRRQMTATREYCQRHGLILDESLRLADLGVSAFKGRNARQGALAGFLAAIESGKVKSGSLLILESLDRLSREEVGEHLTLFISILRSGIEIVTLAPERHYTRKSINDIAGILEPIIYMARAHEESAMKSHRLSAAWKNKKANAGTKKLGKLCPSWLEFDRQADTFREIPEKVEAVRKIFQYCIDGMGMALIIKALRADNIDPISRSEFWRISYLKKILNNRAVLGEYQPHIGRGGSERKPVGEPIQDYYPAIIDLKTFHRAQTAIAGRTNKRGRVGEEVTNLLSGLVYDLLTNDKMVVTDKGKGKKLTPSKAVTGYADDSMSFSLEKIEQVVLHWAKYLKLSDILKDNTSENHDRQAELQAELTDIDARLKKLKQRALKDELSESLLDLMQNLDGQRKATKVEIEKRKRESAAPAAQEIIDRTAELFQQLEQAKGKDLFDLRIKLREKLREVIGGVWVRVAQWGKVRLCYVRVTHPHSELWYVRIVCDSDSLPASEVTYVANILAETPLISQSEIDWMHDERLCELAAEAYNHSTVNAERQAYWTAKTGRGKNRYYQSLRQCQEV